MPKVEEFYVEKGYLVNRFESVIFVYFIDQDIMQRENSMELNFELNLQMQK